MTTTVFTDYVTKVPAAWLNDVDSVTYDGTAGYVLTGNGTGVLATYQSLGTNVYSNVSNGWTKNQYSVPVSVTATSTAAIDASLSNNFTITPTQNFTLSAPTNAVNGMIINVVFTQGATPYTITWDAVWQFPGGVEPTLTASANAVDFMSAYYNGATSKWICVMNKDFKA